MKIKWDVEFTEWALPLEIWWIKDTLCFEILCFAVTFVRDREIKNCIDNPDMEQEEW